MKKLFFTLMALISSAGALAAQGRPQGAPPPQLDVQHYEISAEITPENGFLKGETKVRFTVPQDVLTIPFELNNRLSIVEIVDPEGTSYSTSFDGVESQRIAVRGE